MARYDWPASMLEEHMVPVDIIVFFDGYVKDQNKKSVALEELYKEHELLKDTSAKQDRYIAELEKQLSLLQKTLDLIDKNGGGGDGRSKEILLAEAEERFLQETRYQDH